MLFDWNLRMRFHCYYESSVRFTSGLGNMCRSYYVLLNCKRLALLTLFIVTSCVAPRGSIYRLRGGENYVAIQMVKQKNAKTKKYECTFGCEKLKGVERPYHRL